MQCKAKQCDGLSPLASELGSWFRRRIRADNSSNSEWILISLQCTRCHKDICGDVFQPIKVTCCSSTGQFNSRSEAPVIVSIVLCRFRKLGVGVKCLQDNYVELSWHINFIIAEEIRDDFWVTWICVGKVLWRSSHPSQSSVSLNASKCSYWSRWSEHLLRFYLYFIFLSLRSLAFAVAWNVLCYAEWVPRAKRSTWRRQCVWRIQSLLK